MENLLHVVYFRNRKLLDHLHNSKITKDVMFFFFSDNLDNTVPDHNFLFPEFEIVIETEDEITPEVVEKEEESEIIGSMGKESGSELH